MRNKTTLKIFTVIVGLFFLLSGFSKAIDTAAFANIIASYGFPYLSFMAPIIIILEITLGSSLLLLLNPRRDTPIALFFLISFTSAFAFAHFVHGVNDCGCFGSLRPSSLGANFSFIQNIVLMCLCILVWRNYPKDEATMSGGIVTWKKGIIAGLIGVAIFISGSTFSSPGMFHSDKLKNTYKNQDIKNTQLAKYITTSPGKTYLVFCFSYTCTHCWNSVENVRSFKTSGMVDTIVALAMGTDSNKTFFDEGFNPDFNVRTISPDEMDKLTPLYPAAFYVKNDTIKYVIEGEVPSAMTFRHNNSIAYNSHKTPYPTCGPASCGPGH